MNGKRILFIIHRLYFDGKPKLGGIDRIVDYLKENNNVTLIEHPFEIINHPSLFTSTDKRYFHQARTPAPFLWIEELIVNVIWILQAGKSYDLAIASDPLNFFSCFLLQKLGKVRKTQFHSIDYSKPRFTNSVLEWFYQTLYRFAVKNATLTTVTSKRMLNVAEKIAGNDQENILFLLPNSPNYYDIPKISCNKKNKNDLVLLVGRWGDQINTPLLIASLTQLKEIFPHILLHVIGSTDETYQQNFFSNNLKKNVIFHGSLSYEKAMQVMSSCSIGITAYSETNSYVHYADSLKMREYAAAGLPTVCDQIYATSEEVKTYDSGFVYSNGTEMSEIIKKLINEKRLYEQKSKNALTWAKKMDKRILLDNLYNRSL